MIGRKKEIAKLNKLYNSNEAQFVAIYGRRRIGKTYLINELFHDKIVFKHAGLSPIESDEKQDNKSPLQYQLHNFYNSLVVCGAKPSKKPTNWMDAFLMLELFLQNKDDGSKQVVFIDELPWLDTPKSGFISAFEAFWNNWGCSRRNLMLIVCGSATSWMSDKLINNHGGLYNRLTSEIKLEPFNLNECEEYFKERNVSFSKYDIVSAYMICGGIPYYLSYFDGSLSLAQNIDNLFFSKSAPLNNEFNRLFNSIFSYPEYMKLIIKSIGKKRIGSTRDEIIKDLNISSNSKLTESLNALISSDFIIKYVPFGKGKKIEYYKLTDSFCNFYLKFVEGSNKLVNDFWLSNVSNQNVITWRGIAFESVCFNHINQIKKALGITGIESSESAWSKKGSVEEEGAQIDMLIKRNDNVINMCEIKFYSAPFTVDKTLDSQIRYRLSLLEQEVPKKYSIRPTLITTFGINRNEYSNIFSNVIIMDDLFEK